MPGAGLRAVNFLANSAPKDGTTIAIFQRDMPLLAIIGHNANVRFDARKLTWLGSSSSYANDAYFLFVRKAGGAVDRRCAPSRRTVAGARRHRGRLDRQRRGDGGAQRARPQHPAHPRLCGFRPGCFSRSTGAKWMAVSSGSRRPRHRIRNGSVPRAMCGCCCNLRASRGTRISLMPHPRAACSRRQGGRADYTG